MHFQCHGVIDWADDHSTCAVTLHCNKCQETEEREADVTSKVTTPQYCEQAEITEFTAKLTVDEEEYTNVVSAQTKDALEHDWPEEWEVDTPADCTKNRIDKQECQRCGLERKQEVQETALGHQYTDWVEQTPATCTDPQILEQHCIRGDSSQTKTGDGPKGHQYSKDYQETQPASCLQDGSKRRQCDVCGEWDVQSIPATGHPSYDQNYCCTVCGHLNVDAVAELAEQQFLQYMADSHPEMQTPTVDGSLMGLSYVRGGYVTNHSYEEVCARAAEAGELFADTLDISTTYLEKFNIVIVDNGTQYDSYFYYQVRRVR